MAGATIRPQEILEPDQGDLSAWIGAATSGPGDSFEIEREYLKRKLWPRRIGPACCAHHRYRRAFLDPWDRSRAFDSAEDFRLDDPDQGDQRPHASDFALPGESRTRQLRLGDCPLLRKLALLTPPHRPNL